MNRRKMEKPIDVARTLMARDYKGLPNIQPSNGVVEPSEPVAEAASTDTVGI